MNENGERSPARRKGNAAMRLSSKGAGDDHVCASELSHDKQRRDDREGLSNTTTNKKRTHRVASTALQRWFVLITIVVFFRTVYNSFILSHQDGEHNLDFSRVGPQLRLRPKFTRRKRPPPPRRMTPDDSPRYSLATSATSQVVLSLPDDLTPSSKIICGLHNDKSSRFPILPTSRILILGILSHPLGVELALILAQTCGVQSIVGLADNNIHEEIPPRLAYLLRILPDIQIHRKPAPLTQDHLKEVFASSTFTHIVYLDTLPFSSNIFREDTPPIFGIRDNIHALEQIFKAVVIHRSHSSSIEEPHLVYVTTASSSSLEHYTVDSQLLQQASNSMFHVLAPTFRSLYRVQAAHLKLPYVYGPFQDGATWMTNRFGHGAPKGTKPYAFSQDVTPWIHVTDAIQAITSSLSTGFPNKPESVDSHLIVPKDRTTTLKKMERVIEELRAGKVKRKGREHDNIQFMLAWNYKKEHPFGENATAQSTGTPFTDAAMNFTNSHLSHKHKHKHKHKQTNGISSLQRRQNKLFPCISECGNLSPCQKHSAFDSVIPVSQEATRQCRFALYMVDFSRTLKELYQVKETAEGGESVIWPNHTMCQIAFVSGKSKLVTSLVDKEKKSRSSNQKHTADYNGQIVHNGWTLVWVEHDDADTLSEADYMMPKVAPGGLFSTTITRALYFEPKSFKSLPPLPIIWNLMAKHLDAKSQKNVRQKTARGTQMYIPYIPSRKVALYIHLLWLPDSFVSNSSFDTLARYILLQKGLDSDRPWPRRQLDFYSHVFGMTHGGFPFEWVDTGLIIHNFEARKSRLLRCEWYQEHLFWSDGVSTNEHEHHEPHRNPNRHLEDLSLAYIIGKWRNGGQLLVDEEETRKWGERVLDPGDLVQEQEQQAQLGPDYRAPSQYFLRMSKPMKARIQFE